MIILPHRRKGFRGGGSSDPSGITGLLAWWKADALSAANNDALATWPDSSSNGLDITQSNTSNKPVFKTNQINGKPAIRFDGNNFFTRSGGLFDTATGAEIFAVFKTDYDPPPYWEWSGAWSFGGQYDSMNLPSDNGVIYDIFCTNSRKTVGNPTPSLTSWRLYNAASKDGEWTARLDGTQLFTTATNTFWQLGNVYVGRSTSYMITMVGSIAEIVLFSKVLSGADRASVNSYISGKYGLTIA